MRPKKGIGLTIALFIIGLVISRFVNRGDAPVQAAPAEVWRVTSTETVPPPIIEKKKADVCMFACKCGCEDGAPCSCYTTMRARAVKENKTLIVWVGRKNDGRFASNGFLHTQTVSFQGFAGTGYIMAVPMNGDLYWADEKHDEETRQYGSRRIVCTPAGCYVVP